MGISWEYHRNIMGISEVKYEIPSGNFLHFAIDEAMASIDGEFSQRKLVSFRPIFTLQTVPSGNQTWLAGKSPVSEWRF